MQFSCTGMGDSFVAVTKTFTIMTMLIKYFVAFYFITYLMVGFVWPSVRTYKQTGINPITFGKTDNAHDFIGRWFKWLFILVLITIVAYWLDGYLYQYLMPADFLMQSSIQWIGVVLCIISLVWTVIAQWQMGRSWRIGIDQNHKTELKTSGLFSVSRNPIFLGMLTTLAGYFLLLPNAVTLVVVSAGYLLIQIQIRLEEEFLSQNHGMEYQQYMKTVRRIL